MQLDDRRAWSLRDALLWCLFGVHQWTGIYQEDGSHWQDQCRLCGVKRNYDPIAS